MSVSWAPNGLNELPFQRANHDAHSNPGTQARGPEQGFWRCLTDRLNQSFVSSLAHAKNLLSAILKLLLPVCGFHVG